MNSSVLPLAHTRAWIAASVLLLAAVVYFSLAPLGPKVPMPENFDKLEHALAYTCLAVWFTGLLARGHYWKIVVALAALGLLIEILQHVMAMGRVADPWDMAANGVGIVVGVALAALSTGGWALRVEAWLNRN